MAHFRGHKGDIMAVLYVLYIMMNLLLLINGAEQNTTWYQGCAVMEGLVDAIQVNSTGPVACSRHCLKFGHSYCSVSTTDCVCLFGLPNTTAEDLGENLCHYRCSEATIQIPCGSGNMTSIYSTRGPYIRSVVFSDLPSSGYVNAQLSFHVSVTFAGDPRMDLGFAVEDSGHLNRSDVVLAYTIIKKGSNETDPSFEKQISVSENNLDLQHVLVHEFTDIGVYELIVEVSNFISAVQLKASSLIIQPIPTDLDIVLTNQNASLPACVPTDMKAIAFFESDEKVKIAEAVYVFVNQEVEFQASVATGINLTFHWGLYKGSQHDIMLEIVEKVCTEEPCLQNSQTFVFNETGQYAVRIEVSNNLDSVTTQLPVVVVPKGIRSLVLNIQNQTSDLTVLGEVTAFTITLETAETGLTMLELQITGDTKLKLGLEVPGNGTNDANVYIISAHDIEDDEKDSSSTVKLLNNVDDCIYEILIGYVFPEEGSYNISVESYIEEQKGSAVSTIGPTVLVQSQLANMRIICSTAIAVESEADFTVTFGRRSDEVTFHWKFSHKLNVDDEWICEYNVTTTEPKLSYTFEKIGIYEVSLKAVNLVGETSTSIEISVQVPISGARVGLLLNKANNVAKGSTVSFQASVDSGSHLTFKWNPFRTDLPEPEVFQTSTQSVANYTFTKVAEYNITVEISNELTTKYVSLPEKISVQEKITGLNVIFHKAVMKGNATSLKISVETGSSLRFDVDYGTGRETVNVVAQEKSVTAKHTFDSVGVHQVIVYVENEVSQVHTQFEIEVQEKIPDITLENVSSVLVKDEYSIFVVKHEDSYADLKDVVYQWNVDGEVVSYSKTPLLNHRFPTSGLYNLTVVAYNLVSTVMKTIENAPVLESSSRTRFNMKIFNPSDAKTEFKILELPLLPLDIHVKYGDGRSNSQFVEESLDRTKSWQDSYAFPKIFAISASCVPKNNNSLAQHVKTYVCIQEPIKGLQISGKNKVKVSSKPVSYRWTAEKTAGTHVLYNWTFNGKQYPITTKNQFKRKLQTSGTYTVAVTAFNSVSQSSSSLTVSVIHSISHVTIVTHPVILGNQTQVLVMVDGGREFDLKINFGDGSGPKMFYSRNSSHGNSGINNGEKEAVAMEKVLYNFTINHTYSQVGEYQITVNVTNQVSSSGVTKNTYVEEPISGVRLHTNSAKTVELGHLIVVMGTVTTGKSLQFNWDFNTSDSVAELSYQGKNSTATLNYTKPATYTISLAVTNPLYPGYVICENPIKIKVEQRIKGLEFYEINHKDAAELFPDAENGNTRTQPVQFVAHVTSGSNVKFMFDFGDGSPITVPGENISGVIKGNVSYIFKQADRYSLAVTAFNDLNTTTKEFPGHFYVEDRPDISLPQKLYIKELGERLKLEVIVKSGHYLKFDWSMGDTTLYNDNGIRVSHLYDTAKRFNLKVTAYNRVGKDEFTAIINVIERILGVSVKIDHPIHILDTEITMVAQLEPDKPIAQSYQWNFGSPDAVHSGTLISKCNGNSQTEVCKFKDKGRYNVSVTASNDLGSVTSDPVEVHVVEEIRAFSLKIYDEALVNTNIQFKAYSYSGSDIMYHWLITNLETMEMELNVSKFEDDTLIHNFTKVGRYDITVVAVNPVGNQSDSETMSILEKICKQPVLKPLQIGNAGKKFTRSQYIKIEVEVKINCSISKATNYKWEIYNTLNGQKQEFPELSPSLFQDRLLYLPPRTVDYGNYTVLLEVEMRNTPIRVFTPEQISLEISQSALQSVIVGGIKRKVSRQETLIMDGSKSHDPDYLDTANLTYTWSCKDLNKSKENSACFHQQGSDYLTPDPVLSIKASHFVESSAEFEFALEVCKAGRICGWSEQVIKVERQKLLDVNLACKECEDELVNSDQRLVVEATHLGYKEDELEYTWQLEIVGESIPEQKEQIGECKSRASISQNIEAPDPNNPLTIPTTTTTSTTTTTAAPDSEEEDPLSDWLSEGSEGEDMGRDLEEGDDPEDEECSLFLGCGEEDFDISEGDISEGKRDEEEEVPESDLDTGSSPENDGDSAENSDTEIDNQPPHVLSQTRTVRSLHEVDTVTGLGKRVLVIRPNVLTQDKSFIIGVTVSHKDLSLEGSALVYFHVNRSPYNGQCSLWPKRGVEMDTQFTVYCQGWEDENAPLRYEVSFSLQMGQPQDIVYQGLNHKITFQLPAGLSEYHHSVNISVYISDSLGSKTYVCQSPVEVLPQSYDTSLLTEEEILYELVQENNSSLSDYLQEGDNRNARLHAQMVATRLNRLNQSEESGGIRQKIRRAVLWALKDMPLRDEYEIQQTTTAVALTTEKTQELSEDSLSYATSILYKAGEQTFELVSSGRAFDQSLTDVTVQGTSNILGAVHKSADTMSRQGMKEIVQSTNRVLRSVLHVDTSSLVSGEKPVKKQYDNVFVMGSRHKMDETVPPFQTEAAQFTIPTTIREIIERRSKVKGEDEEVKDTCFQSHVVTYKYNPFVYTEDSTIQVKTQVAALSLLTCEGKELELSDLASSEEFHIHLQHKVSQTDRHSLVQTYTLRKEQINYHQFNLSANSDSNTVNIDLDLLSVEGGRLFPIVILIREDLPPTPVDHDFMFEFPLGQDHIRVTLQPGTLNAETDLQTKEMRTKLVNHQANGGLTSSVYHLGVSDAKFNSGRPRQKEVRVRQYRLKVWHASCRFWNTSEDQWSVDGCYMEAESTFEEARCRCNHLTSFAASFNMEPNDLNFKNIEDFFDLNENPVTFALIACLFTVYLLLLIVCVRKDNQDKTRGAPIYLIDNSAMDKQKYILTLETGFRRNAGTSAKVSIVLHGDEGMSETRELISQSGMSLFDRNSRNIFILTLPNSLGPIYKIQLWHNNAGPSPGWFLSRVTIKDVNSGQGYYFSCERWFAVDRDDGKVEKEFNIIDGGLGFTHVLWSKGTQYFVDYHLWFSTLTRPPYSRFTRAQRLTCCLSLIMSYMAVNAAWYRQTEEEFRGEFGLVDVSWRAVIVGILTSLLVLPPNAFIVWLFRRSRAKRPHIIDEPDEQRRMSGRRDSTSTMDSTSRLLHPVHTPSIFDQSILNWQGLQEWAQKTWAKRYRQSPNGSTQSVQPPVQTLHMSEEMERRAQEQRTRLQLAAYAEKNSSDPPSQRSSGSYGRPHFALVGRLSDRASSNGTSYTSDGVTVSERDILLSMRSHKPGRCFVPGFFRYFAWFLSAVIIMGCAAVTVLYGFRFGRVKSLLWLQSLFFSVMQCIFITHPLLILLMAIYIAVKYRNNMSIFDHHNDGLITTKPSNERQCEIASLKSKKYNGEIDLSEGIAARQRSRYLRFSRPPHEKTLLKSRNQTIKETKASAILNETSIFAFVFLILTVMAFGKAPTPGYQLAQSLQTAFVDTGNLAYRDIKDVQQFWQWIQTDFLDTLYSDNSKLHTDKDSLNKVFTANSHLVGEIHIRQHRVKEQRCSMYKDYPYLMPRVCRYPYTELNQDRKPFGTNGSWLFLEETQTGSHQITGRQGHYGGDGYLVMLSRGRSEAASRLQDMEQENWVDKYTRAVIIEFTLFHPATNLFSSVALLLELPAVGQILPFHRITTADLYKYITVLDNIVLACELLLIVVLLLKLKSIITKALWQRKQFLRCLWNVLDVLFCTVGLGFCGCFVYRFVVVSQTVEQVRATYIEDFVDMAPLAFWDQMLRTLVGVLYFILILQSLKILRHRKPFAGIGNVLKHASLDILVLFMVFAVWIAAYATLSIALYGSISNRLHTLDSAILSTAGLYTKHYPFITMEMGSSSMLHGWRIFVATFLIFALGSMTAYTMAVLNFHYKVYRDDPKLVLDITATLKYYWNQLLQWSGLKPFEFPSEEEKLPTECTIAELNYQVDEMLFKINALAGTANLPEKPHIQTVFTDSDTTYGSGGPDLDNNLFLDGIKNVEFWNHGHLDEGKVQQRIKKIEDNLLFQEPHLAQLLVLDNLNMDELAIDLRNQLELEIFRQLQSGRHSGDLSGVGSDTYPSSLSYQGPPSTNCYQGSASQSQTGSESSRNSGVQESGRGSPSAKDELGDTEKNVKRKVKVIENNEAEEEDKNNRNLYPSVTIANAPGKVSDTDVNKNLAKFSKPREDTPLKALVLGPTDTQTAFIHPTDNIPLVEMGPKSSTHNLENDVQGQRVKGLLPQNVVNLQNSGSSDAVGSSTSSGGREVQSVLSQESSPSFVKSPKPCSHGTNAESTNESQGKGKSGHSNKSDDVTSHHATDTKPKNAALLQKSPKSKKTNEAVVFTYENSLYDTSDSDLSAESSTKSSQPRSLRKTKSRGKGKGQRSDLTPVSGLGLDELGFTNEGYIGEKHKGGHHRAKKKKTTKT